MGKKSKRTPPPVETGHDDRPWERSVNSSTPNDGAQAPDGISGDWG